MAIPYAVSTPRCATCNREAVLSACAGCRSVSYCQRGCQVADWKSEHRHTCANLPASLRGTRLTRWPDADVADKVLDLRRSAAGDSDEKVRSLAPEARTDLKAFLAGAGTVTAVDDAGLAQLVAAAQREAPAESRPLAIGLEDKYAWALLHADDEAMGPVVGLRVGYFAPSDPGVRARLAPGGLWLSGPDARGRYLTMGPNGPDRLVLPELYEMMMSAWRSGPTPQSARNQQVALLETLGDLAFEKFEVFRSLP